MTSVFGKNGENIPCTVVMAGPCVVSQNKNKAVDGYQAVQLAFDDKKVKRVKGAEKGHFKKAKSPVKRKLVEFKDFDKEVKLGEQLSVSIFNEGDFVDVTGISQGKGFQGVVKRHGFAGVGDSTHGQHNRGRAPGSIGAASYPSRVFKGMRMAGRMGGNRVTVENLKIIKIYPEKNLILISGAIPGAKNAYIIIKN